MRDVRKMGPATATLPISVRGRENWRKDNSPRMYEPAGIAARSQSHTHIRVERFTPWLVSTAASYLRRSVLASTIAYTPIAEKPEGRTRRIVEASATGHSPITAEPALAMSLAELLMIPVNTAVISVASDPAPIVEA